MAKILTEVGVNKSSLSALTTEITKAVQDGFKNLSVDFKNINTTSAANKLAESIQKALGDAKIDLSAALGGTASLGGIAKAVGDIANKMEGVAAAKRSMQEAAESAKTLRSELSKIQTDAGKGLSTLSNGKYDASEVDSIRGRYKALMDQITLYRTNQRQVTADVVNGLRQQASAIQDSVNALKTKTSAEEQAAAAAKRSARESETAATREANLQKQANSLRNQVSNYINNNTQAYAAFGSRLNSIFSELSQGSGLTRERLAQLSMEFANIKNAVNRAGQSSKTFLETLREGLNRFKGWAVAAKAFSAIVKGFKMMVNEVKAIDSAMTELRKVTELTSVGYQNFYKDAVKSAHEVGAAVSDTVDAAADFARLGYDAQTALQLAEAALVYKNVGDGIESVSQASESLISTIKAFGEESYSAMQIVDMFNEVGNKFAISSTGVGEALVRSAAALEGAGNSLEESIGLVVAANNVIQNPQSVGTAMKTLTMYLRAAKTELQEAGEDAEGCADSVSQLREQLMALTGVDIMLDDDTFKSTYQIIEEISKVWDNLSDVTQANITKLIGGKRNANVIQALMSNFADAQRAMETASNSAGSALRENREYLDSIEGKLAQIKSSWQELSNSVVGSGAVKTVLDLAKGVLDLANVLDKVHALIPGIITAITLLTAKRMAGDVTSTFEKIIGMMSNPAKNFADVQNYAASAAANLTMAQRQLVFQLLQTQMATDAAHASDIQKIMTTIGLTGADMELAAANEAVTLSFTGMLNAIPIWGQIAAIASLILTFVIPVIGDLTVSADELIEKAHESRDAFKESEDQYRSNMSSLDGLEARFNELSKGVDENGKNVSLTADEYEEYKSIIDQIVSISPGIVEGYNSERDAVLKYKDAIDAARESQDNLYQASIDKRLSEMRDAFKGYNAEYSQAQQSIMATGQAIMNSVSKYDFLNAAVQAGVSTWEDIGDIFTFSGDTNFWQGVADHWKETYTIMDGMTNPDGLEIFSREEMSEIHDEMLKFNEDLLTEAEVAANRMEDIRLQLSQDDWFKDGVPWIDAYLVQLDEMVGKAKVDWTPLKGQAEDLYNAFADVADDNTVKYYLNLASAFKKGEVSAEEFSQAVSRFSDMGIFELVMNGMNEADAAIWHEIITDYLKSFVISFDEASDKMPAAAQNISGAIKDVTDAAKEYQDSVKLMQTAQKEMEESGSISLDTFEAIRADLGPDESITDYLSIENGMLKLNAEAWNERNKAIVKGKIAELADINRQLAAENDALAATGIHTDREKMMANQKIINDNIDAIKYYTTLINNMNEQEAPMKLEDMFAGLDDVKSNAKDLVETLEMLDKGEVIDATELAKKHNGLLNFEGFIDGKNQKEAISAVLKEYESQWNSIIDEMIGIVTEQAQGLSFDDPMWLWYNNMLVNLESMRDMTVEGILSDDGVEGDTEKVKTLKEALDEVSGAISNAKSVGSLITDINSGSKDDLEILQSLISIAKDADVDFTSFIESFDDEGIHYNVEALNGAMDGFLGTVQAIEDAHPEYSGITEYIKGLMQATEEADSFGDHMDKISSAIDILNSAAKDGIDLDTVEKMRDLVGDGWEQYFVTDDAGRYIDINKEKLGEFVNAEKEAADTTEGVTAIIDEAWAEAGSGIEEATDQFKALTDAISRFRSTSELLNSIGSGKGSFLDNIGQIIDIAESGGYNIGNMVSVDSGAIKYNTELLKAYQANQFSWENMRNVPGMTRDMAKQFKQLAMDEIDAAQAQQKFNDALNATSKAKGMIEDIRSGNGDFVSMLQNAADMAEQSGQKASDFYSIVNGEVQWSEEAVKQWAYTMIESLEGVEGVAPGTIEALKGIADAEIEAISNSERMSTILSNVNTAVGGMANANVDNQVTYDQLQSLLEVSNQYAYAVEYNNGILTLNKQKYEEVTEAILRTSLAEINAKKAAILRSEEYRNLAANIGNLNSEEQARLDGLNAEIMGYDVLANQIRNASAAYQQFMQASSASSGEQYTAAEKAFKVLQDTLYNEDSDIYGKIGRDQFKEAKEFLIKPELDMDDAMSKLERYFSDAKQGAQNFVDDLYEYGFADKSTGELNASLDEIADAFGLTVDGVRAGLEEVNQYLEEPLKYDNPEIDVSVADEAETNIKDLETRIGDAKKAIDDMGEAAVDLNTSPATEKLDEVNSKIGDVSQAVSDLSSQSVDLNTATAEGNLGNIDTAAGTAGSAVDDLSGKSVTINTGVAVQSLNKVSASLSTILNRMNMIAARGIINVRINETTVKSTIGGSAGVSGFGYSAAPGTLGAPGGRTLVGELGREIVVDPNTNTWYTVGEQGAEFAYLPAGALVFNAEQTRELLTAGRTKERGRAFASGNAAASINLMLTDSGGGAKEKVSGKVAKILSSVKKTTKKSSSGSKKKSSGGGGGSSSRSSGSSAPATNPLDDLLNKYKELDAEFEHLIEHQLYLYDVAERGLNYEGMGASLTEQANIYRKKMDNAQQAVNEMIAKGAKDTDKQLQEMEEILWDAHRDLYDTLDKINELYVDALNDKIDDMQDAYKKLTSAADEFAKSGHISIDTYQDMLDNGIQFLDYLDLVNGKYEVNEQAINKMIAAEKEQLGIESAIAYMNRINEALGSGEANRLAELVNEGQDISNNSWEIVYAQLEQLKNAGLMGDNYEIVLNNINKLRDITGKVVRDIADDSKKVAEQLDKQEAALDKILDFTQDLIQYEVKEHIKAIEKEIDLFNEIIDLKKESLDTTKSENEYQKSVNEKLKDIAEMQARIDKLALDDSRTAQAERMKLMDELAQKQDELAEFQSDHSYDAQIEALDKMAEEYEKSRQGEIDALEEIISSEEKLFQLAIERIKSQWDTLYRDLIDWNTEQGSVLNSEITDNWELALESAKKYGDYVRGMRGILSEIEANGDKNETLRYRVEDLPHYHGGGVVGGAGAINPKEALAVLQKGEMVLDEGGKRGLYHLIDLPRVLSERFGNAIGAITRPMLRLAGPTLTSGIPAVAAAGGGEFIFNPTFEFNIEHNGQVSDDDIGQYGRRIADTTIDRLYDAFERRGIRDLFGGKIKK